MSRSCRPAGFSVIELVIALTIMGFVIALTVSNVNFTGTAVSNVSSQLQSGLTDIEMAFTNYVQATNTYPDGIAAASFTPAYLFVPQAPTGFDKTTAGGSWTLSGAGVLGGAPTVSLGTGTVQTNGFVLGSVTGATAPNNGRFLCARVSVTGSSDTAYLALVDAYAKLSAQKFFYNTACPAVSNAAAPGGATTLYPTYWLTRN